MHPNSALLSGAFVAHIPCHKKGAFDKDGVNYSCVLCPGHRRLEEDNGQDKLDPEAQVWKGVP